MSKKMKKDQELQEEKRFTAKLEENLPNDIFTQASKAMADALIFGTFDDFENMLADKVEVVLYQQKTIRGKADVLSYWWDWRKRFVLTKKVTNFEVVMSRYYSHACIRIETVQLIMFQIEEGKIVKIVSLPERLTSPYSDDNMLNYPYSFARIKPYLLSVEVPYDEDANIVDPTNHIPCISCGIDAKNLKWFIAMHPQWNNRLGTGLVSICPNCGRVVEFKEGKTIIPPIDSEDETISFPIINSEYSDQGNIYTDCAERIYSEKRIGKLDEALWFEKPETKRVLENEYVEHLMSLLTDIKVEDGWRFELTLPSPETNDCGDITRLRIVGQNGEVTNEITDHLLVKPTTMGAWQLYLLKNMQSVLPVYWHGGYESRTYVFKESDIDEITPLKFHDLTELVNQNLVLPSVQIVSENEKGCEMTVSCCYWSEWKGLVREQVTYSFENGRLVSEDNEQNVLFSYDCGILF